MSYTPINWQTGDTITAEKLNKMDNGWSVTGGTTTICDETVTTVDDGGMYAGQLSADSISASNITVTYDSTIYQCAKDGDGGYGDDVNFTFSDYPFRIESDGFIVTETSGAHTVKIEAVESSADISTDFVTAVSAALPLLRIVQYETTWQQVYDAISDGKIAYYIKESDSTNIDFYLVNSAYFDDDQEVYRVYFDNKGFTMIADSASGVLTAE